MDNKEITIKRKTQIILDEIDELSKNSKLMSLNIKGNKLESYMDNINKTIITLKEKTESFYNKQKINKDNTE